MRPRRILLALVLSAAALPAAQIVTLRSGFILKVTRADRDGDQVFLTTPTGVTIMSAADIAKIEEEPDPTKPAPPPPIAPKPTTPDPKALIRAAAEAHGLPVRFVESVASVESGLNTGAVSPKGAVGVMQLMPATARQLGVDPNDVAQNIEGGTRLLRDLLIKYQNDPDQVRKALAAYNAGPGAVDRYQGIPPYKETQNYVRKIVRKLQTPPAPTPTANTAPQ